MNSQIEQVLEDLGIVLPEPPKAAANYVPFLISQNHVFISGQLPFSDGELLYKGKVGQGISIEEAQKAAQLCAINTLAVLKEACHMDFDRVQRCIKLEGFVNSTDTFSEHPHVINGASDLISKALGSYGHHARVAVGVNSLPFGACVEVASIFYIR